MAASAGSLLYQCRFYVTIRLGFSTMPRALLAPTVANLARRRPTLIPGQPVPVWSTAMDVKRDRSTCLHAADRVALQNFDQLPDSAHVRLPVVAALFGISHVTVWRWSKRGLLPRPSRINSITFWQAGQLRACLATHEASASSSLEAESAENLPETPPQAPHA
jgi:predicted DNA-binding transcriptional regulator AlpA